MGKQENKAGREPSRKTPLVRFPEFKDDWEVKKLGEVLIHTPRPMPKPKSNYLSIGLRSHFKGTFQKPNTNPNKNAMDTLYEIKENDLIVNITFAWEGALAIVTKEDDGGFVSHRFPTYNFEKGFSNIFFKYHFFREKNKNQLGIVSPGGAGRNRVMNKNDFVKLKLPFPTLSEQQKIAHFFSTLDKKLTQLQDKKNALEQYKKGMMQQIFSQQLRFKDDNGKDFPEWEEKRLGEVGKDFKLGGNYINSDKKTNNPLIKMGNLDRGFISLKTTYFISDSEEINEDDLIKFGDLFFNTRNTLDLVGKVAIWRNDIKKAYFNSNLMRIKFDNNFYMNYWFNSNIGLQRLRELATGTTSVAAIYTKDLVKIKFQLPTLNEQAKIAHFLTAIDEKINNVSKQIAQTKAYKKGLSQKMFV